MKTRFDDIGALDKVKRTLYELITLPLDRPELFKEGILREAVSGILLFGPPGTGKTMLAKAVAAQSKSNFIAVNSSNIYDMYVGEGEKNVKVSKFIPYGLCLKLLLRLCLSWQENCLLVLYS